MNSRFYTAVIFFQFLFFNFLFSQGVWTPKAAIPTAGRATAVAFSISSKGYFGTGMGASMFFDDFWEYDPSGNAWSQKANFPGGTRAYAVGFAIGNKGYLGTGSKSPSYFKDFWEYDPVSNIWTQMANFGGAARGAACGFSVSGFGYIGTGYDGSNFFQDFWKYDPILNTWTQLGNFINRSDIDRASFVIGNNVYCGTGYNGTILYNDLWKYDPVTDTWTQQANLPAVARVGATGFSLCNKGFLGFGANSNFTATYNDLWMYNPVSNSWTTVTSVPASGRGDMPAIEINNKIYMGTGASTATSFTQDFWEFTIAPNMSLKAANTTICQGDSTVLTASGALNYLWSFSGQTTSSITVSPSATTNYSVLGIDTCGSSFITITINVIPPVNIVISGDSVICQGQTTTLTASGGVNYLWNNGSTINTIVVSPILTTTYSVAVVSPAGCTNFGIITATVTPTPIATISPQVSICPGDTILLTAGGGLDYLWNTGVTVSSIQVSLYVSAFYSVVVTSGNCADTAFTSVVINPNPVASIQGNINIYEGQSTNLSASGGITYLWDSGETTAVITVVPITESMYCVTVIDTNNCKDTACVLITVESPCDTAGAFYLPNAFSPNRDGENDFLKTYYANPDCIQSLHIIIYEYWGEQVFESSDPAFEWDGKYQGKLLQTSVLTYYLKAEFTDGKILNKKGNISLVR